MSSFPLLISGGLLQCRDDATGVTWGWSIYLDSCGFELFVLVVVGWFASLSSAGEVRGDLQWEEAR